MRVKIISNVRFNLSVLLAGESHSIPDEIAESWISRGLAKCDEEIASIQSIIGDQIEIPGIPGTRTLVDVKEDGTLIVDPELTDKEIQDAVDASDDLFASVPASPVTDAPDASEATPKPAKNSKKKN